MSETSTLRPVIAAAERLRDAIEFGSSVDHPGIADAVNRAGYAIAAFGVQLAALNRKVVQARIEKQSAAPAKEES